jgi:hypothetical protein
MSVAVGNLSAAGRWWFVEQLIQFARCGQRRFTMPYDRLGNVRREAAVTGMRENKALKLVNVIHGGFDRAFGRFPPNQYELTYVGDGCNDEWRRFEPEDDSPKARRVADACALDALAGATPERIRAGRAAHNASRRGAQKCDFRFSPSPPPGLGTESAPRTITKNLSRESINGEPAGGDAHVSVTSAGLSALTLVAQGRMLPSAERAVLAELQALGLIRSNGAGWFEPTETGWGLVWSAVDGEDGDEAARDEA